MVTDKQEQSGDQAGLYNNLKLRRKQHAIDE